ncbi:hypothetical protein GYH30_045537 [Glycine max]|uniref:Pentacotripeptide-repeat region of PRORP domain-containing protein n=1 Tax=Glycine max TaxID=3847 RepID=K7MIM8_SOYBN|nr:hypothetical protein GYH30_045537 [Glycine max]
MHDKGQSANVITYNSLINALCKNLHLDQAISLFKKMKEHGIQIDVPSYTILIDGLCKAGLFDEALALLSKMEDNGCI